MPPPYVEDGIRIDIEDDEVVVLAGPLSLTASHSINISGVLVVAGPGSDAPLLTLTAPQVRISGTVATAHISNHDTNESSNQAGPPAGRSGGAILVVSENFTLDQGGCLATADGERAPDIRIDSVSVDEEAALLDEIAELLMDQSPFPPVPTVSEATIDVRGGPGGDGGDIHFALPPDDSLIMGAVRLGNGGDGASTSAYGGPPSVPAAVVAHGGSGGRSGFVFVHALPYQGAESWNLAGGLGGAGGSATARAPPLRDSSPLDGAPGPGVTDAKSCGKEASKGPDGPDGSDGQSSPDHWVTTDGQIGYPGTNGFQDNTPGPEAEAEGGPGGPGFRDGGAGGTAIAAAGCGGKGGDGGEGGDGGLSPPANRAGPIGYQGCHGGGGRGGDGTMGLGGGNVGARAGNGGDGFLRFGGGGGDAEVTQGAGGAGGNGGDGGDGRIPGQPGSAGSPGESGQVLYLQQGLAGFGPLGNHGAGTPTLDPIPPTDAAAAGSIGEPYPNQHPPCGS